MVGRRIRRGLVFLAALVGGAAVTVLVLVHTPWARSRALTFARDFVTRYNLVLETGSLSYNAVTRRITLTDVRLAAKGHEQRPFLVASRIEVQLPWTVYRRRFAIDHLEITNGIVDIYRDENDIVNLPPGSDRPTPEQPRRLDLRGLTLNGLDVQYTDAARNWGVKIPRIESELVNTTLGAKGNFAVRGELAFRLRDRVMTMAPFETVMTFDGSNVMLEEARLASTEIDAFIAGPIKRVLDSPTLDLTLKGSVNLDKAIKWVPPPPVPVSGMATIEGTITGPARDMVTDLKVSSNTLSVGRERHLDLAGPIRVTFESFSGHDLLITPESGGQIRAKFKVPWGRAAVSTAGAEWSGLDSHAALRLANVDPQADWRRVHRIRHVHVQRAAAIHHPQSLHRARRPRRGADDRHHQRDDRRRRLFLRARPRVARVHARRADEGPHQSRRGDAQHHERSRARAGQRRRRRR